MFFKSVITLILSFLLSSHLQAGPFLDAVMRRDKEQVEKLLPIHVLLSLSTHPDLKKIDIDDALLTLISRGNLPAYQWFISNFPDFKNLDAIKNYLKQKFNKNIAILQSPDIDMDYVSFYNMDANNEDPLVYFYGEIHTDIKGVLTNAQLIKKIVTENKNRHFTILVESAKGSLGNHGYYDFLSRTVLKVTIRSMLKKIEIPYEAELYTQFGELLISLLPEDMTVLGKHHMHLVGIEPLDCRETGWELSESLVKNRNWALATIMALTVNKRDSTVIIPVGMNHTPLIGLAQFNHFKETFERYGCKMEVMGLPEKNFNYTIEDLQAFFSWPQLHQNLSPEIIDIFFSTLAIFTQLRDVSHSYILPNNVLDDLQRKTRWICEELNALDQRF